MSNNKQTAVEWLEQEIKKLNIKVNGAIQVSAIRILEQAKQMEKEQSLNFAKYCLDKAKDLDVRTAFLNVEQYYNETFNTEDK